MKFNSSIEWRLCGTPHNSVALKLAFQQLGEVVEVWQPVRLRTSTQGFALFEARVRTQLFKAGGYGESVFDLLPIGIRKWHGVRVRHGSKQ